MTSSVSVILYSGPFTSFKLPLTDQPVTLYFALIPSLGISIMKVTSVPAGTAFDSPFLISFNPS